MKTLRALLVDDEPRARARLGRLLAGDARVEVAGEAEDGLEAVNEIQRLRPDLVFLDIQMPGLDGFQVLKALAGEPSLPLVIFATGYDEHALAAFEANAIAYLLKPIEAERLAEMVGRAWRLHFSGEPRVPAADEAAVRVADGMPQSFRQIVARKLDRFLLLDPDEILFFFVDQGIVRAKTRDDTLWVNYQLGDLERGLADRRFFRAHRSSLVNLRHVREVRPSARSAFLLVLDDAAKTPIEVSERQARALRLQVPGL